MDLMVYKIKDSVDLFLLDKSIITAYYMNTRQRKTFKVNEFFIKLIENIDGIKTLKELKQIMSNITDDDVENVIKNLLNNKIITEVNVDNDIIDKYDMDRFQRQINYFAEFLGSERDGILAQKKLIQSKLLIFGCGAIGGNIALELAMAGIRDITLFDYDILEQSDTSRHLFFDNKYIGERKADILKNKILEIDKRINVTVINKSLKPTDNIDDLILDAHFVVNTLDEPYIGHTSAKISRICIKYNKPHFIAGGFDAHLASTGELIIPFVTPCVECYKNHFEVSLKDWKPEKHPVSNGFMEIGGLASMSLFSSSFACIEIIKYMAGLVLMSDSFKIRGEFLFNDFSLNYLNVKRDENCSICGGGETK